MVDIKVLISWIPLFPLLGFLLIGLSVHKMSHRTSSYIACGTVFLSFVFSVIIFAQLLQMPPDHRALTVTVIKWIGTVGFSANIAFLVDPLSSVMLLVINLTDRLVMQAEF